ncbi:MAG: HigA family addiction module antidote protein [Gammaproteobacteria bacterium]|nr:HigA family addiction module antidote protein [Gammaproteobacteria bacterium]
MHNPSHPGKFIREVWLKPLGLTVTQAAHNLGVARKTLSALLNGHAGISPEMALRLGKAFNTSPESWLVQQMQYDLWKVKQKNQSLKDVRVLSKNKQNVDNPIHL